MERRRERRRQRGVRRAEERKEEKKRREKRKEGRGNRDDLLCVYLERLFLQCCLRLDAHLPCAPMGTRASLMTQEVHQII